MIVQNRIFMRKNAFISLSDTYNTGTFTYHYFLQAVIHAD